MHLREEAKTPKNEKKKKTTNFFFSFRRGYEKTYCVLKVFQNLSTKLINYIPGFRNNLYCLILKTALHPKVVSMQTSVTLSNAKFK